MLEKLLKILRGIISHGKKFFKLLKFFKNFGHFNAIFNMKITMNFERRKLRVDLKEIVKSDQENFKKTECKFWRNFRAISENFFKTQKVLKKF